MKVVVGVLIEHGKVVDYYNSVTGSWGLQIGDQSYGYAVFLMTDNAIRYVKETKGWELGVGRLLSWLTKELRRIFRVHRSRMMPMHLSSASRG